MKVSLRARDGLWSVRIEGDESEHLAGALAEAVARATGRSRADAWVVALQEWIEDSFAAPRADPAARRSRLRRLLRAIFRPGSGHALR